VTRFMTTVRDAAPDAALPAPEVLRCAILRCDIEIARCEAELLSATSPLDMEGLLLGLMDWSAERRLLMADDSACSEHP
jgi:hypothetical protein